MWHDSSGDESAAFLTDRCVYSFLVGPRKKTGRGSAVVAAADLCSQQVV